MMLEAFERHGLDSVKLEVFDYNLRAIAAYQRVGFKLVGEHTEWPESVDRICTSSRCGFHARISIWRVSEIGTFV